MGRAKDRLLDSHEAISTTRQQIATSRDNLLASWDGMSAKAFNRIMNAFDAKIKQVLDAQEDLADKMNVARGQYEYTEQEQQDNVNAFEAMLNNSPKV